jgi:hypothetical protein
VHNFGKHRVRLVCLFGMQVVLDAPVQRWIGMAEAPEQSGA